MVKYRPLPGGTRGQFNRGSALLPAWFWLGLAGLLLLSVTLHFWDLGRFKELVFDEVYYPKYARNYLKGEKLFDPHPPLGKYIIAVGLWVADRFGWTGPVTYRWTEAFFGSMLPLVVAGLAWQIAQRPGFALLAGFFTAADGLLLVESRLGLINIFLVFFGILSQWFFLLGLKVEGRQRWGWLSLSGLSLGAAISVKWNGLGLALAMLLLWLVAWVLRLLRWDRGQRTTNLSRITELSAAQILFCFLLIPIGLYWLQWIPHMQINPEPGLWGLHRQMLEYHQRLGETLANGKPIHPYCSPWWSWPLLLRPMSYYYETLKGTNPETVYALHGMGNPILWWLSTLALLVLTASLLSWFIHPGRRRKDVEAAPWGPLYILLGYAANYLPWSLVGRCTFLYHYMLASIFSFLALAWLTDWSFSQPLFGSGHYEAHQQNRRLRGLGLSVSLAVALGLVFWLPIFMGLPLTYQTFRLRMWLTSWI
ncbi:phospholipid carrier-dependent glycosyltransferase [Leptolyngbya sp. FACHB-261]|uniref:phospholipid carrier-dependent glycosyltransferase n=1 Tax=Leptolyngbya sp. FACHB-261 TaxID=2692806 RepID=UPI001683EE61|nr:phospholipid carrier-dependent glycosyltransferase [Leptolyngbya sp. FACHB-261]MBD2104150.1 phospholipid carrier-dependent glycosyltransferase [Leptolyngbya sp. FACHB-261]